MHRRPMNIEYSVDAIAGSVDIQGAKLKMLIPSIEA